MLYILGWVLFTAAHYFGWGRRQRTFWRLFFWSNVAWLFCFAVVGWSWAVGFHAFFVVLSRIM